MRVFSRLGLHEKPIVSRFLLSGLLLLCQSVSAQTHENVTPVNLQDAIRKAVSHHPELKKYTAQAVFREGQIQQAETGELPQIGLMIEDGFGYGEHRLLKSAQTTLSFSWVMQQHLIDAKVNNLSVQAKQDAIDEQIALLDLSAATARRFIELLVGNERLKLNKMALQQASDTKAEIDKRVAAGSSSVIEQQLAIAEVMQKSLALEDSEHQLKTASYALSNLWGQPSTYVTADGDLSELPAVTSVSNQMDAVKNNPALVAILQAQRVAVSQIELAQAEKKNQWQFNAGVRRYETTDDFGFVAGVSVPFGAASKNAGLIKSLKAQQDVLEYDKAALLKELDTTLFDLLQELKHGRHVIQSIGQDIIPALELASENATTAFEKGQLSYIQWNEVRQSLLDAQFQLLDEYQNVQLLHVEFQRLTGAAISQ